MIEPARVPIFILAGGLGTRLSEETQRKPKPMVEIGELPILVHLMKWYAAHGFDDFVVCAGYKAWELKSFFLNYRFRTSDLSIDLRRGSKDTQPRAVGGGTEHQWRVRVIDTGEHSMTGSRIARAYDAIRASDDFELFGVTYGDGLTDANLRDELAFHSSHGRIGTVLGVHPVARFGELDTDAQGMVRAFREKPQSTSDFINGGFFFFKPEFRRYLSDDPGCVLEQAPLETLARDGGLAMYRHSGFWQPMDTLRDKLYLEKLWDSGAAPWVPKP